MTDRKSQPTAKDLEERIRGAIREMAHVYCYPQAVKGVRVDAGRRFTDGWEEQGLISTAEALVCVTVPYFSIKTLAVPFWKGEVIEHDILRESVDYLLRGYKVKDPNAHGKYGFGGTPYIDFRYKGDNSTQVPCEEIERNLDFVDAACFVLTALSDLKAISLHRDVLIVRGKIPPSTPPLFSEETISEMNQRIVDAFKVLNKADVGPGNGYSYTSEDIETEKMDFLYFTWNVLETLDALWPYVKNHTGVLPEKLLEDEVFKGKNTMEWFIQKRTDKLAHLTARFLSPLDNPKTYLGGGVVDFSQSLYKDDKSLYYNAFAFLGLLATDSQSADELVKGAKFLLTSYKDPSAKARYEKEDYGSFYLEGALEKKYELGKTWSERGYRPLLLKALTLLQAKFANNISDPAFIAECQSASQSIYESVLADVCKDLEIEGQPLDHLWDGDLYSIYYTERVIESLCHYYRLISEKDGLVPSYAEELGHVEPTAGSSGDSKTVSRRDQVVINITPDVIRDSVLADIRQKVDDLVNERVAGHLSPESLVASVKAELEAEITAIVEKHVAEVYSRVNDAIDTKLTSYFSDLAERIKNNKSNSLDRLVGRGVTEVVARVLGMIAKEVSADGNGREIETIRIFARAVGLSLEDAVAVAIARSGGRELDSDYLDRLADQIRKGTKFLGDQCETEDKRIDFLKTMTQAVDDGRLVIREQISVKPA